MKYSLQIQAAHFCFEILLKKKEMKVGGKIVTVCLRNI
jgi:hypothetical protein